MPLLYKPDWEQTKQRYCAWWRHEYFGRCGLAVYAPKKSPPPLREPPPARSVEQQWYDLDWINQRQQYHMARTFYGGEALPIWTGGYPGHTALPVFLGAPLGLDRVTGWWEPILAEEEPDIRRLRIDTAHPNYRFAFATFEKAAAWTRGKSLVTMGAFGGGGDTLAALRDTNRLLYDCLDRPEWVRDAELYLMDVWVEHFEAVYRATRAVNEGSTCWFPLWSPGRFYPTHNDFSYMISPALFRDLFLPALERQLDHLDHAVHHVDGVAAFAHVDTLCRLPRLQAFEIVPGAGKPSPLHYLEVLRKVQAAGKNLHLTIPPDEVQPALKNLSARGLMLQVFCETEDQARALLDNAEKWSVDRG